MRALQPWAPDAPGILTLPSGVRVRGRSLRRPMPAGPAPTFGLYLGSKEPSAVPWAVRWLRWRDFGLPADRGDAVDALRDVWQRLAHERVDIACRGGRGRTGTALACLVAIDAGPGIDAVAYVRQHYDAHAVETPWQRRYVRRFVP